MSRKWLSGLAARTTASVSKIKHWLIEFNIIGGNPGVQTAVPVLQALGYGLPVKGLTRSPSNATDTMISAS